MTQQELNMVLTLIDAHTTDKRSGATKEQGLTWDGCFVIEHGHLLRLKEQLEQLFGGDKEEDDTKTTASS